MKAARFPYLSRNLQLGPQGFAPFLPLSLGLGARTLKVSGLLDSGAASNILPLSIGLQLGAVWDQQTVDLPLSGVLANVPAKAILLEATVASFPPIRLAFAWAKTDSVPVLLRQINFFLEFDVCFYRARSIFKLSPSKSV